MSKKTYNLRLPVNRKQQYLFLFKSNLSLLFKLNLFLCLFLIPILAQLILLLFFNSSILNTEGLSNIEKYYQIANIIKIISIFNIISIPILTVGIIGISNILKKIIYNDGYLFFRDFKSGIKESKNSIIFSFIYSILITIYLVGIFSIDIGSHYTLFLTLIIVGALLFVLLTIMLIYSIYLTLFYNETFFGNLKNAFIFTFHSLGINILIFLTFSPFIICYLLDFIYFSRITFLTLTATFIYLIFLNVNNLYIFELYSVSLFDKLINITLYPDYYNRGLFKDE